MNVGIFVPTPYPSSGNIGNGWTPRKNQSVSLEEIRFIMANFSELDTWTSSAPACSFVWPLKGEAFFLFSGGLLILKLKWESMSTTINTDEDEMFDGNN